MSSIINEEAPNTKSPPLYFACSVCGECCSSWNIPIEGDKARMLLERPWVRERLAAARRELVRVTEDLYRLPLTDANVCVFLGEDRRCLIEANEGLALKPQECQRFPFAAVRLPDGTMRHDTSAACKQVAEKLLLAFQPILPRPDDSALPLLEASHERMPQRIYAGLFRRIDGADYLRYQQAVRQIYDQTHQPPELLLKQVCRLLPTLPDGLEAPSVVKPGKPGFSAWLCRWVTLCFLRKPYGSWSWACLIVGRRYDDPRVFGLPIDLPQATTPRWDDALNHMANAFLFNLLNRKVLLARGGSLESLLAMAGVACMLLRWYAATLAWFSGRERVDLHDAAMAIRLVERYYSGHQPRFLKFFHSRLNGKCLARLLFG